MKVQILYVRAKRSVIVYAEASFTFEFQHLSCSVQVSPALSYQMKEVYWTAMKYLEPFDPLHHHKIGIQTPCLSATEFCLTIMYLAPSWMVNRLN